MSGTKCISTTTHHNLKANLRAGRSFPKQRVSKQRVSKERLRRVLLPLAENEVEKRWRQEFLPFFADSFFLPSFSLSSFSLSSFSLPGSLSNQCRVLLFSRPVEGDFHEVDSWRPKVRTSRIAATIPKAVGAADFNLAGCTSALAARLSCLSSVSSSRQISLPYLVAAAHRPLWASAIQNRPRGTFAARSGGKAAGTVCVVRSGRHAKNVDSDPAAARETSLTGTPSWCCFATPSNQDAGARKRRQGRFIALWMKKFTSTWIFTTS